MKTRMKLFFCSIVSMLIGVDIYTQEVNEYTDGRDGKVYKTVAIGEQTWMAENLAFKSEKGCVAYNDDESNVSKYGYLYDWENAKEVCPEGSHLPSDEEWEQLASYINKNYGPFAKKGNDWEAMGKLLKSKSGWDFEGNGIDSIGFNALPGGGRIMGGTYKGLSRAGQWWSSTEYKSSRVYTRKLSYYVDHNFSRWSGAYKTFYYSVRCLKD